MAKGTLILIVGLPGSGKGTLINHLRAAFPGIVFPASWTTRLPRRGERDGEVYHFVSDAEFARAAARGEFLEWISIDTGHKYGTRKDAVLAPLQEGKTVIREVETAGARALRTLLSKEKIVTVFINTDSWNVLEARMLERAPMASEELTERRKRYERELAFRGEADYAVENQEGKLEETKRRLTDIIQSVLQDHLSS